MSLVEALRLDIDYYEDVEDIKELETLATYYVGEVIALRRIEDVVYGPVSSLEKDAVERLGELYEDIDPTDPNWMLFK